MDENKVFIFRGLPLVADSRTVRNGSFFDQVQFHTWEKKDKSDYAGRDVVSYPFAKDGGWMILKYPLYLIYLFLFSLLKIKGRDTCMCMDLDTFVPVWLGSFFKRTTLIFDVVDPASQARFKKLPFSRLIDKIEFFFIIRATLATFPHACRVQYYEDSIGVNLDRVNAFVIENMPSFIRKQKDATNCGSLHESNRVVIGYFGTLDGSRGLNLLMDFARSNADSIQVSVAGDGPLKSYVKNLSDQAENISFLGRYAPDQLGALYKNVDFSWMYYDPSVSLHRYAAPNKFYEHLCFKVPVLTNSIIPQARFVDENHTGVVLDKLGEELIVDDVISNALVARLKGFKPGRALNEYWDQQCTTYYEDVAERLRGVILESKK
ncbi:glycosyltransferase [Pseudomonas sp. GD03860]|uniref:glycosyltransferase n=1 Tax=Pseudomonas TaxID=286 RepID=UPI0023644EC2|nr:MULTISPECIES: glycosyltransferase [Pseudomonas]MDD2055958.1 glycosyltransferase [Pseudomonas putida]MDH0640573.1 glycosyltransferase [Pseudomonas sp. GD03860]